MELGAEEPGLRFSITV